MQASRHRADPGTEARRAMMALLSRAAPARLTTLWGESGLSATSEPVRGPETGLVTVRGRMGGGGAPFNLGEATVTRATVRLASGEIGHSYALGRSSEKARIAATIDALWQQAGRRGEIEAKILGPLRQEQADAARTVRDEVAATRVDFFTMVRGED
jgi:alpha-D-ribose 1-methylphosphonate 5-triphosphate synthase subunit PhnG